MLWMRKKDVVLQRTRGEKRGQEEMKTSEEDEVSHKEGIKKCYEDVQTQQETQKKRAEKDKVSICTIGSCDGGPNLQASSAAPAVPVNQSARSDGEEKTQSPQSLSTSISTYAPVPSSSSEYDDEEEEDASEANCSTNSERGKQQELTLALIIDMAVQLACLASRSRPQRCDVEAALKTSPHLMSLVTAESAWKSLPPDAECQEPSLCVKRLNKGVPVDVGMERTVSSGFVGVVLAVNVLQWLNEEEKQLLDEIVAFLNRPASYTQSQLFQWSEKIAFRTVRPVLAHFLFTRVHDIATHAPVWQLENFVEILKLLALAPGNAELCIHQCLMTAFVVCLSPSTLAGHSPCPDSLGNLRKVVAALISKIALRDQYSIHTLLPQIRNCFQHALEDATSFPVMAGAIWGLLGLGAENVGIVLVPVLRCRPALPHANARGTAQWNKHDQHLGEAGCIEVSAALRGAATAILSVNRFPASEVLRDAAFLYEKAAQFSGEDSTALVSSLRMLHGAPRLWGSSGKEVWEPLTLCL